MSGKMDAVSLHDLDRARHRHLARYDSEVSALRTRLRHEALLELDQTLEFLGRDRRLAGAVEPCRQRLQKALAAQLESGLDLCRLAVPLDFQPADDHPMTMVASAAFGLDTGTRVPAPPIFEQNDMEPRARTALTVMLMSAVLNESRNRHSARKAGNPEPLSVRAARTLLKTRFMAAAFGSGDPTLGGLSPSQTAWVERRMLLVRSFFSGFTGPDRAQLIGLLGKLAVLTARTRVSAVQEQSAEHQTEKAATAGAPVDLIPPSLDLWAQTAGLSEDLRDAFGTLILEPFAASDPTLTIERSG